MAAGAVSLKNITKCEEVRKLEKELIMLYTTTFHFIIFIGYIDDVQDTSQEISDEETEEDLAGNSKNRQSETDRIANSPLPEVNKQLTSCSTGTVAGTSSRTSSLTSSNEQDFHVMRRRNAYIQMDPGSVGDPQEISGLLQPMPNNLCQKVRQFSLQF